jgi:hypothetical protein
MAFSKRFRMTGKPKRAEASPKAQRDEYLAVLNLTWRFPCFGGYP